MERRKQKLTTPTLIRILRRLAHRRAFHQRKLKPYTSTSKGCLQRRWHRWNGPAFSSAINRVGPDFKSRRVTNATALADAVFLCGAVLSMSRTAIAQMQKVSAQLDEQARLASSE